jgi:hypothetical protein
MSALEETVRLVKEIGGERAKYFHLSPCGGCNQPSWKQPCSLCSYYPMGNDPAEIRRCSSLNINKSSFLKKVSRAGNIGIWFFQDLKNTVAYQNPHSDSDFSFRCEVDRLIEASRDIVFPEPTRVYEEVLSGR